MRDNIHGWLGPKVRDDPHCTDIGKVWYRESDDISAYTGSFRPLIVLWLFANDLQPNRVKA